MSRVESRDEKDTKLNPAQGAPPAKVGTGRRSTMVLAAVGVLGLAALGIGVRLGNRPKPDTTTIASDPSIEHVPVLSPNPGEAATFVQLPGVVALRTVTMTVQTERHWLTPPRTETQVAAYIELEPSAWQELEKQLGPPKGRWTRRMDDAEAARLMGVPALLQLPKEDGQRVVTQAEYDITKLKRGFSVGATGWRIGPVLMVWRTTTQEAK